MKTEVSMWKCFLHQVIDILTFSLQFEVKMVVYYGTSWCAL